MKYASIDIETTGLDPEVDKILEVGIVKVDTILNTKESRRFVIVDDLPEVISPFIQKLHEDLLEEIKHYQSNNYSNKLSDYSDITYYVRGENLRYSIDRFLGTDKVTVAGKNFNAFDKLFLDKLGVSNFHRRTIDPSELYALPTDEVLPDLQTCINRAELNTLVKHSAVNDAMDVVNLLELRSNIYPR